jgi:hypothetical protein
MSPHYTAGKISVLRLIRWRRAFFGAIIPILLSLSAASAWVDGASYALWITVATWGYVLIIIGTAAGSARALQAHCGVAAVYFWATGIWQASTNYDEGQVSLRLGFGFSFILVAAIAELYSRICRLEAPTTSGRAAEYPGIYCITCRPNGKQYIGQTSQAIQARWNEHRAQLHARRHHSRWLQADWDLYRPEQFSWEVLEVVTDPVWLLDRERYWQDKGYDAAKRYNPPNLAPRAEKAMRPLHRRRPKA